MHQAGFAAGALFLPNTELFFTPENLDLTRKELNFGIVADVHHGMIPDTESRLSVFIEQAISRNVDCIIQMGDFCHAGEKSNSFLNIWNQFKGPKYHVLGNHDMDLNSKEEAMAYWEMPKAYYAFDFQGIHFIVLDANFLYQGGKYIDYTNSNFYVDSRYRTFINDEQIEWFDGELKRSKLPTIVFSHQSLWHYQHGVKNRLVLQKLMERQSEKIICCFNGHNHIDFHHHQKGIDYLDINSMSYQWIGYGYPADRYPAEVAKDYKWLSHIAPYQDPLYAFASINPKGTLTVEGVKSKWMPPSPYDLGMPREPIGNVSSPQISDYTLKKK